MTLQPQARSQPIFDTFVQFYVVMFIVKHTGCHIVNAVAPYFVLPQKYCNNDMMMIFTYRNKDKWFYLTVT